MPCCHYPLAAGRLCSVNLVSTCINYYQLLSTSIILYLTQPPAMTRAWQSLCQGPQKLWSQVLPNGKFAMENPLYGEFHEALCQYKLISTSCWSNEKWRLVICRQQSEAFFSVWAGHDIIVRPFITLQPPAQGAVLLPLFNNMFAGAAVKPLWRGYRACAPHKFLCCSCAPSGPTGWPCALGPAPVVHR